MEKAVAHQLGMAMALCSLGAEMLQKHEPVLREFKDMNELVQLRQTFQDQAQKTEKVAGELNMSDEALESSHEAEDVYRSMHDTFFDAMTEDASHVLQWLAMNHAASLSIWAELNGAAETMDKETLHELSDEALQFQRQSLETVEQALMETGQKTAKQA